MVAVCRLTDRSSHGGTIITASATVRADGLGCARVGDSHACPIAGHGTTPLRHVTAVSVNWEVDGRRGINVGDIAGCGATMITGSGSVNIA